MDAPLTETGLREAQVVAEKLEALLGGNHTPGTAQEEALVAVAKSGGCVFASPLTRAVQTALVALGPIFQKRPELKLVLDPNMRESVDKVHWDSVGDSHLDEIKAKALAKLKELGPAGEKAAHAAGAIAVDASATKEQWWSDVEETEAQLEERIKHFLSTIRAGACQRAVVVGHSSLFR